MLAVLLTGLYSCQSNQNEEGGQIVENGTPTNMSISLVIPQTYAANDPNARPEEIVVKTVDVFIFSNENTFLKRATLSVDDFTYDGSGTNHAYKGNVKIATSTGPKKVYVGVNLPGTVAELIEWNGPTAMQTTSLIEEMTSLTDGYAMFSDVVASKTMTTIESENVVSATVKRLVAKVAVKEVVGLDKNVAGGKMSNMTFAIRNANKLYFPLPWDDAGIIKDPNWASAVNSDFDQSQHYISANPSSVVDNKDLVAAYAMENTTQGTATSAYQDEATFVSIQMSFVPNTVINYFNGTDSSAGYTNADNSTNLVQTFYHMLNSKGESIYAIDKDILTDYANTNSLEPMSIKTYNGGEVYYFTYLNKAKKFNIYRNDFYKVNVTKLIGLGEPAEHNGGHVEIPTDANMSVNIEVLNWNLVDENVELIGQ